LRTRCGIERYTDDRDDVVGALDGAHVVGEAVEKDDAPKDAMPDSDRMNGDHHYGAILPALPPPRPLLREAPVLDGHATEKERTMGWASVASGYNLHLPCIYSELDEFRAAINLLGRTLYDIRDFLMPPDGLPPMRKEMGTLTDIAVNTEAKVVRELQHRVSQTPGPNVEQTPEEFGRLVRNILDEDAKVREEAKRLRADQDELAARRQADIDRAKSKDKAKKDRIDKMWRWVASVSASLFVLFVAWLAATLYAKSQHDQGVAEGVQKAITATASVAPPPPPATAMVPDVQTTHAPPAPASPAAVPVAPRH
jgi:hypothetical protein